MTGPEPEIVKVACALRNKGTVWEIIADEFHAPKNVDGVIQHEGYLDLIHKVGAAKVITCAVTVDETYAANVRAGASVGLDHTVIKIYRGTGTTPVDPATVKASNGNLWVWIELEKAS